MVLNYIRIGVPYISVAKLNKERKDEEFAKLQYHGLSPTTGGVRFEDHWKKDDIVRTTLKFTVLGKPYLSLNKGDYVAVCISMPPDANGDTEIKFAKFAKVTKLITIFKENNVELTKIHIKLAKNSFRSYDHWCQTDHEDGLDCRGKKNQRYFEDTGPADFFADNEMADYFKKEIEIKPDHSCNFKMEVS